MIYPALYPEIMAKNFTTLFFVDLESTGLDPWRCEILTLSLSAVDYFTLQRRDSIELTFRPQNKQYWDYIAPSKSTRPMKKASEIHGISLSKALYFDDKIQSSNRMLEFMGDHCGGAPQIMVCHAFDKYRSGNFMDIAFIMAHLEKIGLRWDFYKLVRFFESTDTYFREARRRGYYRAGGSDLFNQVAADEEGEDFKLPTLCKHYKIKLKKHHHAQDDREGCEALYSVARNLGGEDEGETSFHLQGEVYGEGSAGAEDRHVQLQDREGRDLGTHYVHPISEESHLHTSGDD